MNVCLNCEKPTELNQRTLKPRKYCSKKCTGQYWRMRYQNQKPEDRPLLTRQREAAKKKRADELAWYRENWLTATQIAETLGIHSGSVHGRAQKLNILGKLVNGNCRFWPPEAVEKLKYKKTPIPEGYITRKEAAEYLGFCLGYFEINLITKYGHPKNVKWQETDGHKTTRYLYKKEDLDKWMAGINKSRAEAKVKRDKLRQEKREAKEEADKKFQKQISGLITSKEAAAILGLKGLGTHGFKIPSIKPKNRFYYKPEDVETYRLAREAMPKRQPNGVLPAWKRRTDNWKDPKQYEAKLQRQIKENRMPKKCSNISVFKNINFNKQWGQGNIIKLECASCKEQKPFYDYYVRWDQHRARDKHCKQCLRARTTEYLKTTQYQESLTTKLRRIVGVSVKQHISKNRDSYAHDAGAKLVWQKIKQHCGYDEHDLKEYIEAQFTDLMSWETWGRIDKAKKEGFSWNIDHIVPKSTFHYTSLDDKQFKECWSLSNLRPMGAVLNSVRGNKDLMKSMHSSYSHGLKNTKSNSTTGIWAYLPYTPMDARDHLERYFDKNISWANWGACWHIDHIIPQARLPFDSMQHENFQKLWSLGNLIPLSATENLAKGSFYEGFVWVYDDVDVPAGAAGM